METGVLTWTTALEALYGLPPGEFGGRIEQWVEQIHPADRERTVREFETAIRTGRDFASQFRVVWPDGSVHDLDAYGVLIRNALGESTRMIGVNIDVTERESALRAAREAIQARDQFISVASHELRTPLTGLSGLIQIVDRQVKRGSIDLDRLARSVSGMREASARLLRLTDDLLDVSRLQTGHMYLVRRDTDIVGLVRDEVERQKIVHGTHHFNIDIDCTDDGCVIEIDPDRLAQIITNLLENAAKYSPTGSEIRVSMTRKDDGLMLSVRDSGIGVPTDSLDLIFEPFGRAANAATVYTPGIGLGLFVSKQIAEAHGGRLWAESEGHGHGTAFHVWLPFN